MNASADGWYQSDDGLRLYYRHFGQGATGLPVVCLPGITRNSRDFADLAAQLAERHPVITPDFRGRGFSAWDPDWTNYRPRTYVDDVRRLLDELAIDRAALVGTSLGGLVATAFTTEWPERVAGVVLNDIGPEIGEQGLARIKGYIGRATPVSSWDDAVRQAREIYELAWPGLNDADWHRLVRRSYRENDAGIPQLDMDPRIGDAAREVGTGLNDPWSLFAAVGDTPLLLVQGASSDILTDEIVAKMQARKPDLQHVKVSNRGHTPLLDEADCLPVIEHFLETLQ